MLIFSLVPLCNFILLYLLSLRFFHQGEASRRQAFLCAATLWGVEVVIATEGLNLFQALHFGPVLILWIVSCLFLSALTFLKPSKVTPFILPDVRDFSGFERVMLSMTALIIFLVAIVAFMSAPNGWDAINYHMGRVYFWTQNHSVNPYPTIDWRQLFFQPWSSYVHLHFQVLTEMDRFAALTSWFSFFGTVVAASLIGLLMGLSRRGQILTSLCVATIPTAIVEASGVRGDAVAAFWLAVFVSFLLLFQKNGRFLYAVLMGLIFGLGALTKGTFPLLCAPFMGWFIFMAWRKYTWPKWAGTLLLIGVLVLGINAGFLSRNIGLAGNVVSANISQASPLCLNTDMRLWISNILRTTGSQFATPIKPLNRMILAFVEKTHDRMGISIIDPRNTYTSIRFAMNVSTYEDNVTNFMQTTLTMLSFLLIFGHISRFRNTPLITYVSVMIISYCVCVSFLKWSHHFVRYVLPVMVLGILAIPIVLEKIIKKGRKWLEYLLVVTLICTATPYVFKNNSRRLVSHHKQTVFNAPRMELYFLNDLSIYEFYSQAVKQLPSECTQIGFYMGLYDWDYPLAVMLKEKIGRELRIEHIHPADFSSKQYPLGDFDPCAVFAIGFKEDYLCAGSFEFEKIREFTKGAIYRRVSAKNTAM